MPHDPLTTNELLVYTKYSNIPKRRFMATPPDKDGIFGYYDIDNYLSSLLGGVVYGDPINCGTILAPNSFVKIDLMQTAHINVQYGGF